MNKRAFKIVGWTVIALMAVVSYFPIVILIIFSFSSNAVVGNWENFSFSFQLYVDLFNDTTIMTAVKNTFIIAGIASVLATFIGTFSAIGIYYLKRRLKAALTLLNQITMVNADIVTAFSMMLFFFLVFANRLKGFPQLIIAHTVITLPYVILSVLPRLSQLNPNLYEAGLDLGARPGRTLFTVVLPQLVPSMISGFILAFTLSLDDYVISIYNKGTVNTISTLIYSSSKRLIKPAFRALSTLLFVLVLTVLITINAVTSKRAKKAGHAATVPFISA